MRMRPALALALAGLVLVLAACTALAAPDADDAALMTLGRTLSQQFERGDLAAVLRRGSEPWRVGIGGPAGLAALRERVLREDGPETGVIQETARREGSLGIYRRIARRNVGETPTLMEWTLDASSQIVALEIRPQPTAIPSGKSGY